MIQVSLQARPALPQDQHQIANLMFFEAHVHRHLDWRAPLEWLGSPYYWVIEDSAGRILAALACPPDPPGVVAWVRLFSHAHQLPVDDAWSVLWNAAIQKFSQQGGVTVALIVIHQWLLDVLRKNGFDHLLNVLMLEWKGVELPDRPIPEGMAIRKMVLDDLQAVAALDAAAFQPLWQNPLDALEKAIPQATSATVVEDSQGLVGYQISTQNPFGAHLARLAVRPDAHRRGVGSLIVADLIHRLKTKNIQRLTVNTQSDNYSSLALYKKLGFVETGEKFPVYCYSL